MKKLLIKTALGLLASAFILAPQSEAQAEPAVVVELFTSQGCYSCPPADEVLGKLAEFEDIVALAMHVDYWDYLGWRDTFAQRGFTQRQFSYRDTMGERVVYTPQMIIQGVNPVTGSRSMSVKDAITQARAQKRTATLDISEAGAGLTGLIAPVTGETAQGGTLFVAKYTRNQVVDIARGENGGKTLTYHNVVDMLSPLAEWDGSAPTQFELPRPGPGEGVAIWLQDGVTGPILGAAKFEQ